mgnify:FL=1
MKNKTIPPLMDDLSIQDSLPLPAPPPAPAEETESQKAVRRASLLPKWFLDSKAASQETTRQHSVTTSSLKALGASLSNFGDLIEESKKGGRKRNIQSKKLGDCDNETPKTIEPPEIVLGLDVFVLVLTYVTYKEWISYSIASKDSTEFVMNAREDLWGSYYQSCALAEWEGGSKNWNLDSRDDSDEEKEKEKDKDTKTKLLTNEEKNRMVNTNKVNIDASEFIYNVKRITSINHLKAVNTIISAFSLLKSERSRRRSNEIEPSVFSKKDKILDYHMPVSLKKSGALLMSQINTCSKDQRLQIMRALQAMIYISGNFADRLTNDMLQSLGTPTILCALLSNESGAVKELAANNLANFLGRPDEQLRKLCLSANALKTLTGLLSSPSATVSMHGGMNGLTSIARIQNAERIRSIRCQR